MLSEVRCVRSSNVHNSLLQDLFRALIFIINPHIYYSNLFIESISNFVNTFLKSRLTRLLLVIMGVVEFRSATRSHIRNNICVGDSSRSDTNCDSDVGLCGEVVDSN